MMFYAGIGSRETPPEVLSLMTAIARRHAALGWTLRSGAADGADTAFEDGAGGVAEIWVPWRGFNGHSSAFLPTPEAIELAALHHPAWARCSRPARLLHARNGHQVLGADLQTPATHIVCWTPGGSGSGGTGQALRIARAVGIPIFDLGVDVRHTLESLGAHVRSMLAETSVELASGRDALGAPMPRVLNKRLDGVPAGAVYVGRPTRWGNPFPMAGEHDRDAVCDAYERWIATQPELIAAARTELAGKELVCWCAPRRCHAETLLRIANTTSSGGRSAAAGEAE